jgi:hypothetical protein
MCMHELWITVIIQKTGFIRKERNVFSKFPTSHMIILLIDFNGKVGGKIF